MAAPQKRQRRSQNHQSIELTSSGSLEMRPPAHQVAFAAGGGQQEQALYQASLTEQPQPGEAIAAAGQKRLWGTMLSDDITIVDSLPASPPLLWGNTRPRARGHTRPTPANAGTGVGPPIVILDEDSPVNLSNSMKQQLHLQSPRTNSSHISRPSVASRRLPRVTRVSSQPLRPSSITANPSIANVASSTAAALGQAAAPAARRVVVRRAQPLAPPVPNAGQRRSSNSSSSSAELVSVEADVALAHKLSQEEEDRLLAQHLMKEEEKAAQAQLAARHQEYEAIQAAAAAAALTSSAPSHRRLGRTNTRTPGTFLPLPGCGPLDSARVQLQHGLFPAQPARLAADNPQHVRAFNAGQALAQMLLSMPMPHLPSRPQGSHAGGSFAARRGLSASLMQMREAMLGMQRAGLPPHLLFSDRDFTADDYELLCRLDETVENRKGASATAIEALPIQTVPTGGMLGAAGERLSCAVCLEEFVEGCQLRCLPCLHKFHKSCIDTWLCQKASCPVCNRDCTQ